jgi:hypothetical protein
MLVIGVNGWEKGAFMLVDTAGTVEAVLRQLLEGKTVLLEGDRGIGGLDQLFF